MTLELSGAAPLETQLDLIRTDVLPPLRTRTIDTLRGPFAAALRRLYSIHVHGASNVPAGGPVILASNHIGTLDGPLLVALNRRSLALAKSELFESRVGPLLHLAGQIPVTRTHHDVRAVRRCVQVLQQGRPLAIFPEGLRGTGDLTRIRPGVAYLAMVTGAPIVPVAILGTRLPGAGVKASPPVGSPIHIVYGDKVHIPAREWPRRKTDVARATHELSAILADHVRWAELKTGMRLPAV
ncbi:lysophospholipid acyltransferase family protein [Aestuariimicrobium kwangyangense]|uniref:lysophospholipid acyltransferase family protein n=1 Tax=Aestuariimicrobium kwangyangense TaxID=396389 RepID=UPI0003B69001|nr:lysophospholipid acyltransferase family protein [Aestuariimicrobium kwangyangense]